MEKMVPIDTLTSMFMDPSSGSYSTTYLPAAFPGGTGTGSGSSSDAVTHTRPVCCTLLRTVSFAKRSSFCCRSPETLTVRNSVQHTGRVRSEEHTSELQSLAYLVCRLLLEKKKQ